MFGFGVIFGAIWAEEAWGRYWGWDPKETVAFIAWVIYAAYLHARSTAGWRDKQGRVDQRRRVRRDGLQPVLHQPGDHRVALLCRGGLILTPASGQHPAADQPPGFRSQQRFSDPAEMPPPEWTAPTPPNGLPLAALAAEQATATPIADTEVAEPQPYLELSTVALLGQPKRAPSGGWRRWVYLASGTLINLGEGPKAIHRKSLTAQVDRPLRGCYRIALLSLKGGVGKTTITATLGATFASIRGDRVIAVDANPDRGTLSQKVPLETPSTVRHLLRDAEGIESYSDVSELHVAGSQPAGGAGLGERPRRFGGVQLRRLRAHAGGARALLQPGAHRLRHGHAALGHVGGAEQGRRADRDQLGFGGRRPQRVGHAGLAGRPRLPAAGAATRSR